MTEHPIVFNLVRAVRSGRKTQTRRVVKGDPVDIRCNGTGFATLVHAGGGNSTAKCPYGIPGDQLWVRETWQYADWSEDGQPYIRYRSDDAVLLRAGDENSPEVWATLSAPENYKIDGKAADHRWRPPVTMPRWASRITLEVLGVRVERLQDISEADAAAEGATWHENRPGRDYPRTKREAFSALWYVINGKKHPWESNPWVWVIEFKKVEG